MTRAVAGLAGLAAVLALAACGDDEHTADARRGDGGPTIDGPPAIDGQTFDAMVDAVMFDAVMSTVTVTPDCTGIPGGTIDLTVTTSGFAFRSSATGVMDNPPIVINAGDIIDFDTPAFHNFASDGAAPPQFRFQSGAVGIHRACLTFTQATGGAITYHCQAHPSMTNTLTVQ